MSGVPFPVEMAIVAGLHDRRNVRRLLASVDVDGTTKDEFGLDRLVLVSWWEAGARSFAFSPDLFRALAASDGLEPAAISLPAYTVWIDLEEHTIRRGLDDADIGHPTMLETRGIFATKNSHGTIILIEVLSDGTYTSWKIEDEIPSNLDETDKFMRRFILSALSYLMDPAHDEDVDAPRGSAEWRHKMRAQGVKDAGQHLPLFRVRTLGRSYRLPPEADVGTGRKLGLRVHVRGHFARQRHGPGRSLVKTIWRQPYWRGPVDAPIVPSVVNVG